MVKHNWIANNLFSDDDIFDSNVFHHYYEILLLVISPISVGLRL